MDPAFDRGEIDRASLDATERLRARLSGRPPAQAPTPRRSVLPWVLAGSLFVFSAGMIANPWFERSVRSQLPFAATTATPVGNAGEVKKLQARIDQLESQGAASVGLPAGERLARTEARVEANAEHLTRDSERIDKLTSEIAALTGRVEADTGRTEAAALAATAAADRAQGMIGVLLARQAIEAGRRLGGIEMVLRQAFEARYPQAVAAVAALGAAPVTLTGLRRDFAGLNAAPEGAGQDWWQTLTEAVRSAVTRPGDAPVAPRDAAAAALARGDVAAAARHLRRLPEPRPGAINAWLAAADRWQAGMAALTTLETAAVTVPTVPPQRDPNSALPTRTTVAPSIAAVS
ncbi:hypothetical protein [Polymorphobacter fuscus]|uniref:Uncharacterized protein n=1 Tax=Sandarakinorhabdus fusca TaxID=1439888 RepID=A0A7C9GR99_9SPHN|nr:hypothetical protein [Polymorphobacter fuscus]KAB7647700.1 hypothetical protein F9290_06935 [Polymorphobacter fuscus]MQT16991.1 hypothetical protein [Polymorphobacter fuscus]NJC09018.1 outer membrane murein-binding lipoprotein Lpp [Polymorphobacter fuscus]